MQVNVNKPTCKLMYPCVLLSFWVKNIHCFLMEFKETMLSCLCGKHLPIREQTFSKGCGVRSWKFTSIPEKIYLKILVQNNNVLRQSFNINTRAYKVFHWKWFFHKHNWIDMRHHHYGYASYLKGYLNIVWKKYPITSLFSSSFLQSPLAQMIGDEKKHEVEVSENNFLNQQHTSFFFEILCKIESLK